MMDIECYEKLCTAIVKQGIYDYKKALERVRRYPKDENAMHMKEECERFFKKDMEIYSVRRRTERSNHGTFIFNSRSRGW